MTATILAMRESLMNHYQLAIALFACTTATTATAQTVVAPQNVTAGDVVTSPLQTFNIKKDDIPPVLIAAREDSYGLAGLRTCRAIGTEIGKLDAVLGPDIDVASDQTRDEKRGNAVGVMAKSVISSFIPFGGVIREVTGAADRERQWQVALYAGASRRAFLKGYGQARGCRYPARAATAAQAASVETPDKAPHPRKHQRARRK